MEWLDTEWVEELLTQIREDQAYCELDAKMNPLKKQYLNLCRRLSPEDQKILEEYQKFRSRLEICFTYTAYKIGVEHGKKRK